MGLAATRRRPERATLPRRAGRSRFRASLPGAGSTDKGRPRLRWCTCRAPGRIAQFTTVPPTTRQAVPIHGARHESGRISGHHGERGPACSLHHAPVRVEDTMLAEYRWPRCTSSEPWCRQALVASGSAWRRLPEHTIRNQVGDLFAIEPEEVPAYRLRVLAKEGCTLEWESLAVPRDRLVLRQD